MENNNSGKRRPLGQPSGRHLDGGKRPVGELERRGPVRPRRRAPGRWRRVLMALGIIIRHYWRRGN